jgi:integrase
MDITKALIQVNTRLKPLKISILQRGDRLSVQASLPPKPKLGDQLSDLERATAKRQQTKLSLGLQANPEGLRLAEAKAREISGLLMLNAFDWGLYAKTPEIALIPEVPQVSIKEWLAKFEEEYFTQRAKNPKSLTTWHSEYAPIFKKLPQNQGLTEAVIMAAIATTTPETRTRKRYVMSLSALAKFAGLEIDIRSYGRGHTPAKLEVRKLPTDEDIVMYHGLIPNKSWQNAFALMATYGLRPHEICHLDFSILPNLHVLDDTKTGERIARAMLPEWVDLFGIKADMLLPRIVGRTNREIGDRVVTQFSRYAIGFPPYNLRHAWCVRGSVVFKMPVAIMAKMAGHSAAVHEATYLRHLREDQVQLVYEQAMKK